MQVRKYDYNFLRTTRPSTDGWMWGIVLFIVCLYVLWIAIMD